MERELSFKTLNGPSVSSVAYELFAVRILILDPCRSLKMQRSIEQWYTIKVRVKLGKSAMETLAKIQQEFGAEAY